MLLECVAGVLSASCCVVVIEKDLDACSISGEMVVVVDVCDGGECMCDGGGGCV